MITKIYFAIAGICLATSYAVAVEFTGANFSGAEFASPNNMYPLGAEWIYSENKDMNIGRLPFSWERLQPSLYGEFDPTEFTNLNAQVSLATSNRTVLILDPHNYAAYNGNKIGTAQVPFSAFSNLWSRLATIYRTNNYVWFGLMNEPNSMDTVVWHDAATNALYAIRQTGATHAVLIPGNAWTGAHSWAENWYGTPNADVMRDIHDPADNFYIEVHEYFDFDFSGTTTNLVTTAEAVGTLTNFTVWARTNHFRAFLGEFAVPNSRIGNGQPGGDLLTNVLNYIQSNSDVWTGWAWWASGPKWPGGPANTDTNSQPEYMFLLDPVNLGQADEIDRPAMKLLQPFIPVATPNLMVASGNHFQFMAKTNHTYQPQFSAALHSQTWTNSGGQINGSNQIVTLTLSNSSPQGFYRVQVMRSP